MELLVFVVLLLYFIAVRLTLSVEKPAAVQHLAEAINELRRPSRARPSSATATRASPAYLTVLLLFILLCNLMGLIPGLESPTADVVVPLGCALVTFVYYHYHGIRANGFGYFKQFLGPVWWLYPLMLPIEIISHFARVLSLTVRLYANMFAGDMVTLAFFSLIPIGVPLLFLGAPLWSRHHSGVCLHGPGDGLSLARRRARALASRYPAEAEHQVCRLRGAPSRRCAPIAA